MSDFDSQPTVRAPLDDAFAWPTPDLACYPEPEVAIEPLACEIEGLNGATTAGELLELDPAQGLLQLRLARQRRPLALRLEQFRRLLLSKLRVVFENAAGDIELWSKSATAQVDQQLRERRKALQRRREALERIESATGDLEQRIAEVEAQDAHLRDLLQRLDQSVAETVAIARGLLAPPDSQASAA